LKSFVFNLDLKMEIVGEVLMSTEFVTGQFVTGVCHRQFTPAP